MTFSASEHERLEIQTQAINQMMHDQPNQAPLTEPRRILEVGCGTGNMTRHFAKTFTSATDVLGVDLSPVPTQESGERVKFLQGDFRRLAEDLRDSELQPGSFDYIFSRMLVYGMTDWPGYVSQAKTLMSPGGWLELQEIDMSALFDENQAPISESWAWLSEQQAAWANRGLDMSCAPKLEGYLREAGFVNVQVKEFRWMFGSWHGHSETDLIARYSTKYLFDANFGAFTKVCGPSKTPAELEEAGREMRESYSWEDGKHNRFFVVYGQKPT